MHLARKELKSKPSKSNLSNGYESGKSKYGTININMRLNSKRFVTNGYDIAKQLYLDKDFNYTDYKCSTNSVTCHQFVQMMWKETHSVGCAYHIDIANRQSDGYYIYSYRVLCKYFPKGDVPGKYKQNILPKYL